MRYIFLGFILFPSLLFANEELFSVSGVGDDLFGRQVSLISDSTGDGIPELLVSSPSYDAPGPILAVGRVSVIDGSTGANLGDLRTFDEVDAFGTTLRNVGDLDGDGKEEFIAFYRKNDVFENVGAVHIYTSSTYAMIKEQAGFLEGDFFGHEIAGISDLNGNGGRDYLLFGGYGNSRYGRVAAYDGKTHALIYVVQGTQENGTFGRHITSVNDLDGDGISDFAVGCDEEAPLHPITGVIQPELDEAGRVHFISGASGSHIAIVNGDEAELELCDDGIFNLGDVDGDGSDEIACANDDHLSNDRNGHVRIINTATRETVKDLFGGADEWDFGDFVAPLGDRTGDGRPEFAVYLDNDLGGDLRIYKGGNFKAIDEITTSLAGEYIVGAWSGDFNLDGNLDLIYTICFGNFCTVKIVDLDISPPSRFTFTTEVGRKGQLSADLALEDDYSGCVYQLVGAPNRKKLDAGRGVTLFTSDEITSEIAFALKTKRLPRIRNKKKAVLVVMRLVCGQNTLSEETVLTSFAKARGKKIVGKRKFLRILAKKLKQV